jgi:hypothetical protein
MEKIIQLFNKKNPDAPPKQAFEENPFALRTDPIKLEKLGFESVRDYDYRGEWDRVMRHASAHKFTARELEKHEVILTEIGKAISIASTLKQDTEAANFFIGLASRMVNNRHQLCVELKEIPEIYRGYVWSLDYQVFVSANAIAEFRVSSIIDRQMYRHIYF